jgi:molybdate transport system regulatory protein
VAIAAASRSLLISVRGEAQTSAPPDGIRAARNLGSGIGSSTQEGGAILELTIIMHQVLLATFLTAFGHAIAEAHALTDDSQAPPRRSACRTGALASDDMNNCFRDAVIATQPGGVDGGGTTLTPFGHKLIECYRAIGNDAMNAARKELIDLEAALKVAGRRSTTKPSPRMIRVIRRRTKSANRRRVEPI